MKKKYVNVLNRITGSIPQYLLDKLIKIEPLTPTMKKVFEMGIKKKGIRPELKEQMKAMLDAGELDQKIEVVDKDVEKEIELYLEEEIKKAIENGELPPITKRRAIHKKLRQYYGRRAKNTNEISNN